MAHPHPEISKVPPRGLSTEGNLRLQIDWASLIVRNRFTVFALFTWYLRAIFQVQAPGGLIFGGAYFRNFTVLVKEIYYSRHVKSALLLLFLYFQL